MGRSLLAFVMVLSLAPSSFGEEPVLVALPGPLRPAGTAPPDLAPRVPPEHRHPRDVSIPLADRLSADPETRAREILFLFREYRVFSRDEEMAQGVRELHRIGAPAIPILIAELDRTERENTLRILGIAARAMNDPRLVPALIRAIPRTLQPSASDCGVAIEDEELRTFMLSLEKRRDTDTHVSVGRPVNEIHRALEWLTPYRSPEPDPLRHVTLGPPEKQPAQREQYRERQEQLEAMWSAQGPKLLGADELRRWAEPTPPETLAEGELDAVARAGQARFGALFPTGPDVRLGPVHAIELFSRGFADAPSSLDFDRHRSFRAAEGMQPGDRWAGDWMRRSGIDIAIGGSNDDLRIWRIDPVRWETIDEEVRNSRPLAPGTSVRGGIDFLMEPATVLFSTREGGMGILEVSEYRTETASRVLRYRMWSAPSQTEEVLAANPALRPASPLPPNPHLVWGKTTYVTLETQGEEPARAWSISQNERVALPGASISSSCSPRSSGRASETTRPPKSAVFKTGKPRRGSIFSPTEPSRRASPTRLRRTRIDRGSNSSSSKARATRSGRPASRS